MFEHLKYACIVATKLAKLSSVSHWLVFPYAGDDEENDAPPAASARASSPDLEIPLVPDMELSPLADAAKMPPSLREETLMSGDGDEKTLSVPSSDKMPPTVADDAPILPSSDAATQRKPLEAFVFWLGPDENSAIESVLSVPASTNVGTLIFLANPIEHKGQGIHFSQSWGLRWCEIKRVGGENTRFLQGV